MPACFLCQRVTLTLVQLSRRFATWITTRAPMNLLKNCMKTKKRTEKTGKNKETITLAKNCRIINTNYIIPQYRKPQAHEAWGFAKGHLFIFARKSPNKSSISSSLSSFFSSINGFALSQSNEDKSSSKSLGEGTSSMAAATSL